MEHQPRDWGARGFTIKSLCIGIQTRLALLLLHLLTPHPGDQRSLSGLPRLANVPGCQNVQFFCFPVIETARSEAAVGGRSIPSSISLHNTFHISSGADKC